MERRMYLPVKRAFGAWRSCARLAHWLGPWADQSQMPDVGAFWEIIEGEGRPIKCWVFHPKGHAPRGCYLLLQGVHYQGPEDPRMERFARILAYGGFAVFAPCVPDYINLRIRPESMPDAARIFRHVYNHPMQPFDKIGVFTISFGSLLGFALASSPEFRDKIDPLILFGGYINWKLAIRFCLTGKVHGESLGFHDKLNLPVLFLHVYESLDPEVMPEDMGPVLDAWREQIKATWGRLEMKVDDRHHQVALAIAERRFPEREGMTESQRRSRHLFLVGAGVTPGAPELIEDALSRSNHEYLNPHGFLEGLRCAVHAIHGADDDVIPWTEAPEIQHKVAAFTQTEIWLTGLYGHTGNDGRSLLSDIPAAFREISTMLGMLRVIAN